MQTYGPLLSRDLFIHSTSYRLSLAQLLVRQIVHIRCFFMLTSPGPVIGGFVSEKKDFRWLEWVILFMVAFNYLYSIPQFETYKKTILQKRHRTEKQAEAPTNLKAAVPSSAVIQRIVLKPFKMLFVEMIVLFMTIYMAFNFAVFYSFFAAFPYIFGGQYGFTGSQEGLTFISDPVSILV